MTSVGPGDVGGFDYVGSSKPTGSSVSKGQSWWDTDAEVLYVHNGTSWRPQSPGLYETQTATNWGESYVTVTYNKTRDNGGSVQIDKDTSTAQWSQADTYTSSSDWGVEIVPQNDLYAIEGYVHGTTGNYDGVRITRVSDGAKMAEITGSFSGADWHKLNVSLTAGTSYTFNILTDASIAQARQISPSYPYTSQHVDITSGSTGHGNTGYGDAFDITDVRGYYDPGAGDVLVQYDAPSTLRAWDLASFSVTKATETVTIDVEDGTGTVLYSNIGQNFDISTVDTSKDIQLRAHISRTNVNNEPTVDALSRRYLR